MNDEERQKLWLIHCLLSYFADHGSKLADLITLEPEIGTPGESEILQSRFGNYVRNAVAFANMCNLLIFDHLCASRKLLSETVQRFAFLTNTRSVMETAARSRWLLDPSLSPLERYIRTLKLFLVNAREEKNTLLSSCQTDLERRQQTTKSDLKIDKIITGAHSVGVDISGFKLQATQQIRDFLGMEFEYRYFSGIVHGHGYAIIPAGLQVKQNQTPQDPNWVQLDQVIKPMTMIMAGNCIVRCFAMALWGLAKFCLKDTLKIEEIIDNGFDIVGLESEKRFWRSAD